jgi:hypothetical protein
MIYFGLTIFISAFLVFQVQPMIGKYILPWFGSSTGVWTSSLLFFQVLLLLGYAYAHFLCTRLSRRAQVCVHVFLLAAVLLLLPITPSEQWKPDGQDNPIWHILWLLCASVGGPYLLLASSAPLLQHWFTQVYPDRSPYRLYALSNAGSLLALLSYPFVFEYFLALRVQILAWSMSWGLFAVLSTLCAWQCWRHRAKDPRVFPEECALANTHEEKADAGVGTPEGLGLLRVAWWLLLSASGSVVLMATLNQLTQDVPPVPFLFVLPLSLYLLTFIMAFGKDYWYKRILCTPLLLLSFTAICITFYMDIEFSLLRRILLYLAVLFTACLCCHGELARLRPAPSHLTLFYLMMALGGALGGAFVAVAAPYLFNGYWEYEIGLMAAFAIVLFAIVRDLLWKSIQIGLSVLTPSLLGAGSVARRRLILYVWGRRSLAGVLLVMVLAGLFSMVKILEVKISEGRRGLLAQSRSFYGTLRVTERGTRGGASHAYLLWHGQIKHGRQFRGAQQRSWPTTYYGNDSGVGVAIDHHPRRSSPDKPLRLGVVGLGAGTLAAYVNQGADSDESPSPGDSICFYEIDPDIVTYAERYFTFLQDARDRDAHVDVLLGDARIVMEQQHARGEAQGFDVLAIDAFSGDAIPMHLLTKECFELYWFHLKSDGILAVHISNRYLDLLPVVAGAAELRGAQICLIEHDGVVSRPPALDDQGDSALRNDDSSWVLVTYNTAFLESDYVQDVADMASLNLSSLLWTDDFSSLLGVLE